MDRTDPGFVGPVPCVSCEAISISGHDREAAQRLRLTSPADKKLKSQMRVKKENFKCKMEAETQGCGSSIAHCQHGLDHSSFILL